MNALIILLVAIAVLVCGYIFYGGWLAKQWGVDPNRPTPAHELEDGVDYVSRRRPTWCWATISRPSPAPAPSTAPSRRPSSAGCPCFCGCSSAASSSAPCTTSALCSPPFATRARRSRRSSSREHRQHGQEAVLHLRVPDAAFWWWPPSPPSWRAPSPWCRCPRTTPPRLHRPGNLANMQHGHDLGAVHRA